jgi:diacylglycerol kinase (ATP)
MRICLYWNHTAGGGVSLDHLTSVIEGAGHTVARAIDDESDLPEDMADVDCVAVAGGDGTVARAGRVLAGGPVPMAILPLGTANNIASSLDISGDIDQLVERWHEGQFVKIDVGVVEQRGGAQRFLESVGYGLVTACIVKGRATLSKDHPETHIAEARELYLEMLGELAPRRYDIMLDGERITGEFLLVEALNTPSIGPKLEFTTHANAADGLLSVVTVAESEREALVAYLKAADAGSSTPAVFKSWRVKCVEISGADALHIDDEVIESPESPASIRIQPLSLAILA